VGGAPSPARLQRILSIAEGVCESHHFRLLEFPFNLLESEAAQPCGDDSFLSLARRSGLVTLGNRPLNARGPLGEVRLATCEAGSQRANGASGDERFQRFLAVIRERLEALGSADDPLDFTIVQFLRDAGPTLQHPDRVHAIFRERLAPLLGCLYPEGMPAADRSFFEGFESEAVAQARRNMSDVASRLREKLERDGVVAAGDPRPLAEIAVDHGLRAGVGHVLVGMRSPAYVDQLKKYF
jgi:hypothetical protein